MKIIIGASKSKTIGSWLIRWWLGTPYSHVYSKWYLSSQERNIVYHASHGMVHFKCNENFKKENQIVQEIELEITDELFKKFSRKCIDLAGEPYSELELIQILLSNLSNGRISCNDHRGYICSELLGELLEDLGYKFDKPNYMITPKDIMDKLNG